MSPIPMMPTTASPIPTIGEPRAQRTRFAQEKACWRCGVRDRRVVWWWMRVEQVWERRIKDALMYDVQEEKSGSARTRFKSHRGEGRGEESLRQPRDSWRAFGTGRTFQFSRPAARTSQRLAADFFFSRTDDFSDLDTTTPANTVKMAPKKAAVRAPQENVSLGPQVREGKTPRTSSQLWDDTRSRQPTFDAEIARSRTSR